MDEPMANSNAAGSPTGDAITREEESALLGSGPGAAPADATEPSRKNIDRILKIPLTVKVLLVGKNMKMEEVLRIIPGSVLEFEKPYNEPLDILVHDQPIGRGEVVTVG
ncbi:MAG: FliM/FliN family flagellar motor switch protein, partial [Planctomycetota bacterium]